MNGLIKNNLFPITIVLTESFLRVPRTNRDMSAAGNFVYDSEGNLIEDRSKNLKISYDWRGMPVEF